VLVDNSEEKLPNAILYFAANTQFCGKTKLFKLLYFLDFQHYQEIGRSVTGVDYFAWDMGPVPKVLFNALNDPDSYKGYFEHHERPLASGNKMLEIAPQRDFNPKIFTKRELRLLEALATEYNESWADDMVEATHLENLPWHHIYEVLGQKYGIIPYSLALRKSEAEVMKGLIDERDEFQNNYGK
jgi:uncharacterized phage-associated protein